ncbi:MAG: 50S ribosomal protein L35ae, partial [Thermoprotei archaeon]
NLVGGKVIARDSYGNMYVGRVIRAHARGRNNVVIAVFKRSPPGQMIGSEVLIYR